MHKGSLMLSPERPEYSTDPVSLPVKSYVLIFIFQRQGNYNVRIPRTWDSPFNFYESLFRIKTKQFSIKCNFFISCPARHFFARNYSSLSLRTDRTRSSGT